MTDRVSLVLTPAEQRRSAEVVRLREAGAAGVGPLLALLGDPSWAVRRQVVAAIAAAGAPAVAPLCELLRTRRDDETRLAATVDALAASAADPLDAVTALAGDENPAVVADVAQVIGRRRDPRAVPLLARLASHPDDNVAVAAVEALGRVGGRAAMDALLAAVGTAKFFRVFPAIDVLGRSGDPRAVPALARLLRDPAYALEAARALARTGEAAAVSPLASLFTNPSEAMVRVAASAIAELHARHADRYGSADPVEAALLRAGGGEAAPRHLVRALANADDGEKTAIALVLGVLGGELALSGLARLLDAGGAIADGAAAGLKRLGPASELQVRQALREGPSARRRAVLPIVSRATATPELVECLADPDPEVRALAADALARVGATSGVHALFGLLSDPNARVVQAATGAIQALGTRDTKTLALEASRSGDPGVRRAALRILAYFGYDAGLPSFLEALGSADVRLREVAIGGLPFLDDPRAHEALLGVSRDPSPETRRAAMRAMGHSASADPRVVAALLKAIEDADAWVRYYAAQALGRLGTESATGALARLLGDPAGQVRVAAVEALSHFRNDTALAALREAASSDEPDLERAALVGLGLAARHDAAAILVEAAQRPDAATRLVAVSALSATGSPEIVPALARAARDPDEGVRNAAIGFLAAAPGADATGELVEVARALDDRERAVAVLAVPAEGRIPGLLAALDRADEELAPLLASALARMRSPIAARALVQALESPNAAARKASATALGAVGTRDALEAVRAAARRDPDPDVRNVCAVVVGE